MAKRPNGAKRGVTMQDVAKLAGVSRATVSRIVNAQGTPIPISETTRRAVQDAIRTLGYTPNRIAQSLMNHSTRVIGLSMVAFATPPEEIDDWVDIYSDTVGKIIGGVHSITAQRNYDVQLLGRCEVEDSDAPPHTNSPLDFVEGVIYVTQNPRYDLYTPIVRSGIPLVMVGPNPSELAISSVAGDNSGAVYALTSALARRGHRRIGLILPRQLSDLLSRLREEGYRRAHQENGLQVDPALIVPDCASDAHNVNHLQLRAEAADRLLALPDRPTAIVVAWADAVLSTLHAIKAHGLRCPDDIELVSYGDEPGFATSDPGITALDLRLASMAATAAQLLFDELEGKSQPGREVLCAPRLRVRGSCPLGATFMPQASWASADASRARERG